MDEVEVAVHLLVLDEGAPEYDLGDEHDRDDIDRGLPLAGQRGDEESQGDAAEGGEEHRGELHPVESADRDHPVADQCEEGALRHGEEAESDRLGQQVVAEAHVQVALAQKHRTVADDVVDAVGQAQEHRHHQREEEVGRDVEGRGEVVALPLRVAQDRPDQEGEHRRLDQRGQQVGPVAELADEGALEQDQELAEFVAPAEALPPLGALQEGALRLGAGGDGDTGGGRLLHLLHEAVGLELVAPVFRGEAPRWDELAAVVLFVDDVAAQVAQRGLQHIEDELRPRRAAGLAASEFGSEELFVLGFREVGQHLGRRSEEDQLPSLVEEEGFLEHLEDLRGGLVDRHEDDLVVGHAADDLDDVLGILGREAAGRLVEEVDVGRADHVQADVETLALAPAEHLPLGSPDDLLAALVEAQLRKLAVDPALPLAA